MYMRIFCLEFFDILKCVKDAFQNKGSICTQEPKHHSGALPNFFCFLVTSYFLMIGRTTYWVGLHLNSAWNGFLISIQDSNRRFIASRNPIFLKWLITNLMSNELHIRWQWFAHASAWVLRRWICSHTMYVDSVYLSYTANREKRNCI
jgi:hypothetical protein